VSIPEGIRSGCKVSHKNIWVSRTINIRSPIHHGRGR
jgi:hypothetical protein